MGLGLLGNIANAIGSAIFRLEVDSAPLDAGMARARGSTRAAASAIANEMKSAVGPIHQLAGAFNRVVGTAGAVGASVSLLAAPLVLLIGKLNEARDAAQQLGKGLREAQQEAASIATEDTLSERARRDADELERLNKLYDSLRRDKKGNPITDVQQLNRIYAEQVEAQEQLDRRQRERRKREDAETENQIQAQTAAIALQGIEAGVEAQREWDEKLATEREKAAEEAKKLAEQNARERAAAERRVLEVLQRQTQELLRQQDILQQSQAQAFNMSGFGTLNATMSAVLSAVNRIGGQIPSGR